jgi:hypothetical protein
MNRSIRFALLAAALACVGAVNADDFNPPPWRGAPMSDFQQWEFKTDGPLPELSNNPFGQPAITQIGDSRWLETFEGRDGVWCIPDGSAMVFFIPDADDPTEQKIIRMQVTYFGGPDGFTWNGGQFDQGYQDLGNGWTGTWADYLLPCQPFNAYISGGPIYVDEVVIDAVCVPEPGTIAAFAAAGLGLILRRRKR